MAAAHWALVNLAIPIVLGFIEKLAPDLVTRWWKWGHERKRRIVRKLEKIDTRGMTVEEIAEAGRRRRDLLRKGDGADS